MQIQFNTDNQIEGRAAMAQRVEASLHDRLKRFEDRISRVEVHLADVNAQKSGPADKRCTLEARPTGLQPIAVTHEADSVDQVLNGAADKLVTAMDRTFGKLSDRKGH